MRSIRPTCGVVVLNYNSHDLTVKLVETLISFDSINYICVVDNCSKDNFDGDFKHSKVHYIKNTYNAGYNAGNNIGLKYLVKEKGCKYLFIANPDVIFTNDTIIEICKTFEKYPEVALISTKRYGADNAMIHQYFNFPTLRNSICNCFFLTRMGKEKLNNEIQNYQIDNAKEGIRFVDAVPGAFFALRAVFLTKNNYLYEGIFLYGEELFIGRQAYELGFKSAIINSTSYIHNHVRSKFSNSKMFWYDRVSLRKYYKKFKLLSLHELLFLDIAIVLGTIEYRLASSIWYLLNNKR